MTPEDLPESEGRDVAQRRGENNVTNKAVGIDGVGEKSEMTEHPAHANKTDNGERDSLEFAASAIPQNWNQQDQRNLVCRLLLEKKKQTGNFFIHKNSTISLSMQETR